MPKNHYDPILTGVLEQGYWAVEAVSMDAIGDALIAMRPLPSGPALRLVSDPVVLHHAEACPPTELQLLRAYMDFTFAPWWPANLRVQTYEDNASVQIECGAKVDGLWHPLPPALCLHALLGAVTAWLLSKNCFVSKRGPTYGVDCWLDDDYDPSDCVTEHDYVSAHHAALAATRILATNPRFAKLPNRLVRSGETE